MKIVSTRCVVAVVMALTHVTMYASDEPQGVHNDSFGFLAVDSLNMHCGSKRYNCELLF